MQQLIEEAADAGIEILPFQEQLLVRMLFTGKFLPGHEELFVRVSQDEQAAAVSQAYVSWFSRKYLTEDLLLPAPAVLYIEAELRRRKHLNAFCELAFLKAFANTPKEAWKEPAEQILKKYLLCGVWLDFYEKLPEQMRRRYLLFGIRVIQYCGRPGETLYITRTPGRREQLREVLPGIYAMRVDLFPGEEVTYRIFNPDNELLREACFRQDACEDGFKKTRYGCVSSLFTRIPDSRAQYEYAELCDLTEVLFEPIEE